MLIVGVGPQGREGCAVSGDLDLVAVDGLAPVAGSGPDRSICLVPLAVAVMSHCASNSVGIQFLRIDLCSHLPGGSNRERLS